eukprot:Gb_25241 [translate_table: standard]
MEETINEWMTQNKDKIESISMKVIDIRQEFVKLEIGGNMIQLIIPSSLQDARDASSDNMHSDSTFLVICLEEEVADEALNEALLVLNEKLERVRIELNSLNKVLDNILLVFRYYRCKKPDTSDCSPSHEKEGNISEEARGDLKKTSYLHRSAEEARVQCQEALSKADEYSIMGEILPWCSVSVDPRLGTIEVELEINGIMSCDNVTTALGFCFDSPLIITLNFSDRLWSRNEASLDFFRTMEVSLKPNIARFENMETSIQRVMDELDENTKIALSKYCLPRTHQYGPQVLVPEMVKEYFYYYFTSKKGDDYLLNEEYVAESDNIFVGLLLFLGTRLSTLRNWCVVCKNQLSSFSRLWYCDAELWYASFFNALFPFDPAMKHMLLLYRFEELGLGASVLQELQNSELIDLELSLAVAASTSTRDVFEPYPTFLLKERQIRSRSGFFSNYMAGRNIECVEASESGETGVSIQFSRKRKDSWESNTLDNKMLHILEWLINSFPPVAEMQNCASELELKLKLGISWLQKQFKDDNYCCNRFLQEDCSKNVWLPYNVLRYVLFTNRLSLQLLRDNSMLNVPGSVYQFAVLYNSEREQYIKHCRATEGSVFAFHGSPLWNWYSILRLPTSLTSLFKFVYVDWESLLFAELCT